jgi:methylmalonyl-CoA/ethylmalonyl-CoA epimerase
MPEEATGISSIGQIAIPVHDLPRAVAFYRDILKLPFLFQAGDLAFFQCGQTRMMLSQPEAAEFDHPASLIYYQVDDLDREFERLIAEQVVVVDEPHLIAKMEDHELWMAFFKDSEGNPFGLMQEYPL